MQRELAVLERAPQVGLGGQAAAHALGHLRAEELVVGAAGLLRVVHRGVRIAHQRLGGVAVARIDRDADAAVGVQLMLGDLERLRELGQDAAGHARGFAGVGDVREADDELVAAQPRGGVLLAQAVGEALRDGGQQQVADRVAERVVDVLEAVEIEEQHGELAASAMRAGDRLPDAIREQRPVGQAGQRVVMRHVHDALVGKAPLGDLGLQSGVDAGKLQRAFLDALLERALGAAQRALGGVALPVLALDHAVGVAHDHEQHAVEHAQQREDGERHHPLRALDARQERRDVVVDFEHGADGAIGTAAHGNVGGQEIGVLDRRLRSR